jgi:arylsulfatase A-like enzyme/tetratricopeptide (TPR) repeat protein
MIPLSLVLALAGPPNVILVTIDTLRADYLHAYGRASIETPTTDGLAREGVLVEDATVQAPQTRPSHASILTGRYPWEHGVRDNFSPALSDKIPTLASVLHQRGYRTGAFVGAYVLGSNSGFARGFDVYDEPFSGLRRGARWYNRPERTAWEVVERAMPWLKAAAPGPFFAWLHLYDPHAPYAPPAPYAKKYADQPYEGEVAYADAQVGRLVQFLDERKIRGRTLFIVTSDHGEGLGDHGENEHTIFVYDTTVRVPLILSQPGVLPAGKRIRGQFRSVDILPTVLELIGAPAVPTSGASRARELRSGTRLPDSESPSEALFGALHFGYAPVRALRAEGWKFIDVPRPELYNLREDPQEARNLVDLRAPVAAAMRDRLRTYDRGGQALATPPPLRADAGTLEKMAALGYVGGPVPLGGAASGADPKDKIEEFQRYRDDASEARSLFAEGRSDAALAILDRLAKVGMTSFDQMKLRGDVMLRKRRYQEAIQSFEAALRMVPKYDRLYADISEAYLELGRHSEARAVIERGLAIEPDNPLLLTAKGSLLLRLGELPAARKLLEDARTSDHADARLRVQLARVYRALEEKERAVEELQAATRLEPSSALVLTEYGEALAAVGRKKEAMAAFRTALKQNAYWGEALLGLARLHLPDNPDAALPLLQRLVSLDPGFPGVGEALRNARAAKAAAAPRFRVIRAEDRAGAEELARAMANGGAMPASAAPEVPLEGVEEPARAAAARLAAGQVTEVVETPSGFVVVKRER